MTRNTNKHKYVWIYTHSHPHTPGVSQNLILSNFILNTTFLNPQCDYSFFSSFSFFSQYKSPSFSSFCTEPLFWASSQRKKIHWEKCSHLGPIIVTNIMEDLFGGINLPF